MREETARLLSPGVHEYWNNSTAEQYSCNFGESEGIERVRIGE